MEIALRTAGALLGELMDDSPSYNSNLPDWVLLDRPSANKEDRYIDEFMGSMW
jgi:hypothetical protein